MNTWTKHQLHKHTQTNTYTLNLSKFNCKGEGRKSHNFFHGCDTIQFRHLEHRRKFFWKHFSESSYFAAEHEIFCKFWFIFSSDLEESLVNGGTSKVNNSLKLSTNHYYHRKLWLRTKLHKNNITHGFFCFSKNKSKAHTQHTYMSKNYTRKHTQTNTLNPNTKNTLTHSLRWMI